MFASLSPQRQPGLLAAWRRGQPALSTDALAVVAGLAAALACNGPFFAVALAGRSLVAPGTWAYAAALAAMVAAAHTFVIALVLHRRAAKPLLALLIVVTALATYYMSHFGVFLDPTMLRNVASTQWAEAREVIGWPLAPHLLLYAALPLALLVRVRVPARPWRRALARRLGLLAASLVVFVVALLFVFHDVASLLRNQREVRYLVTPANVVYSAARVLGVETAVAAAPRAVVGADARLVPAARESGKPALLVIVVGETARAANWGLGGYARNTTPELAATAGIVNFQRVTACGTNTETSLPCMFSAIGRRDYDEKRIRGSESLLHVLARAGVAVRWRDNQAGCKGVCDGLAAERIDPKVMPAVAALCDEHHCLDEALLHGLDAVVNEASGAGAGGRNGPLVLVLHMLGNHGPAYYRRHPAAFKRFVPACENDDLARCTREEIVNAYDNALTYTDHVLARTVRWLEAQSARFDTAMIYASDHGESLGERGLYLHGVPYLIAPPEQTQVPMVWWLSPGFAHSSGLSAGCLEGQARKAWTHDSLFHSTLGLIGVQTSVYDASLDIAAPCRPQPQ